MIASFRTARNALLNQGNDSVAKEKWLYSGLAPEVLHDDTPWRVRSCVSRPPGASATESRLGSCEIAVRSIKLGMMGAVPE
jgi:hypothetical protein